MCQIVILILSKWIWRRVEDVDLLLHLLLPRGEEAPEEAFTFDIHIGQGTEIGTKSKELSN